MENIEALKKKIGSTEELRSIVRTMKTLAAVTVRQFEKAVGALEEYNGTVERGLQIVLGRVPREAPAGPARGEERTGRVIFGSDRGMCGPFNQRIYGSVQGELSARREEPVIAVGARVAGLLESGGTSVQKRYAVPAVVGDIGVSVGELIVDIERWHAQEGVGRTVLYYNRPRGVAGYYPEKVVLLPLDPEWLQRLTARPWPTKMLPTYTMERGELFSALVRQYFFAGLYRAFADSIAAENAGRLAAMQAAERTIGDRLQVLNAEYHRVRQESITNELLEIVSGYETVTGK